MPEYGTHTTVTDEERRDFLKALGVAGALGASGVTLNELRESTVTDAETSFGTASEFAEIGETVRAEMAGTLDAELLATQQEQFTAAVTAVPSAAESGAVFEQGAETFEAISNTGWPIYDHLAEAGFFETTTEQMPAFNPDVLAATVQSFVGSEALAAPVEELGIGGQAGVDLVSPTINQAEEISHFHWIASDGIPADHEMASVLPPITQRAAGGVLLWLQNLDSRLYQSELLITNEILADAVWDVQSMAAGFNLMTEGAKSIEGNSGQFSDAELGTLVLTSIALQEISQRMLPTHMHWITNEMRDPGNVNIDSISI